MSSQIAEYTGLMLAQTVDSRVIFDVDFVLHNAPDICLRHKHCSEVVQIIALPVRSCGNTPVATEMLRLC